MLDPDIQALVVMGDLIGATGLYQQRHGGSVLAARKAIDAAAWALSQSRGAALSAPGREIDELLQRGDKIGAVKRYREQNDVGLKEAVDAIEARIAARSPAPSSAPATILNDPELDAALRGGRKIDAVKRYRELHGVGLKEAVDAVEAMQAGITPAPPAAADMTDPELLEHMRAGLKINAIKRYRELHGVGLKEAKDAVEAIMERPTPAPAPAPASGEQVDPELAEHLRAGLKINAIKRFRELYGLGLKECKDAVEAIMDGTMKAPTVPVRDEQTGPALQPELDRLIAADQKIMAIKHYREVTRVGLKEAKDAVEARIAERQATGAASLQPELDRLIAADQKIMAIKHYREVTGVGLAEAKGAVESRMADLKR